MTMRERFFEASSALLERDARVAVVLADISAAAFGAAARRYPERVINVGIREQLMLGVASGLALEGFRPIAHSYAPFLIERAYEQVKLDFGHQGVGAILVSVGASFDWAEGGRTHHAPADVALMDALPGWVVQVPGHPDEVGPILEAAVRSDDATYVRLSVRSNRAAHATGGVTVVRRGGGATVVAVGPMLDSVLAATADLDVTVLYAVTVRPFDAAGLRAVAGDTVILVEPYLEGTSTHVVSEALQGRLHRTLAIGVPRVELRRYGTARDHEQAYGLDPHALRRRIQTFITTEGLAA